MCCSRDLALANTFPQIPHVNFKGYQREGEEREREREREGEGKGQGEGEGDRGRGYFVNRMNVLLACFVTSEFFITSITCKLNKKSKQRKKEGTKGRREGGEEERRGGGEGGRRVEERYEGMASINMLLQ